MPSFHGDGTAVPSFAKRRIGKIVLDGLRRGPFRRAISGGIGKDNRRELVIEAGKSHKFTIPEDELPL